MKKIVYILTMLFLVTFGFQSCEDLEEVETPNFDVAFNSTAKVGEPVVFTINNAPTFLNFFSGEFGREIKNSNRTKAEGEFTLSFSTARHYQNGTSRSDNAWSLLVSTDYTGSGTAEDVNAATWTDISDRFVFATARTFNPKTNSGIVNITDLASDLPTYFAIRVYTEGKTSEGNRQGTFRVFNFDLDLDVANEDYSFNLASLANPGFKPVNIEGTHPTKPQTYDYWRDLVGSKGFYELHGGKANYTNNDWLITNPLNLSGSVSPDRGVPLKTYAERLETFEHTYSEPGTYKIAFIGNNETIHGKKEIIKEYTITVTN